MGQDFFKMRFERARCPGWGRTLALFFLCFGPYAVAYSSGSTELQSARVSLSAARDALSAASEQFRVMQSAGASRSDSVDFLQYLGRLKRTVLSNCRTVQELKQQLGDVSPELGCDTEAMRPSGPVSFPQERTEQERIASLDGQLGSSMSEFDEMLLREMDELQSKRSGSPDSSGGSGTGGAGSEGSEASGEEGSRQGGEGQSQQSLEQDGEDRPEGQGEDVASQSEQGQQQSGAQGGSRPEGKQTSQTGNRDAPPVDSNDDIVARQLREAAEKETDPVLKEKLWEEYRRYKEKQTTQSKNLN